MPRVTKKQKEAGRPAKKKPATTTGKPGSKPGAKAAGFKVGPSNAPRAAYLGKALKKKAELIEAAKVKKQYAKVLAAEGMKSARVQGAGREEAIKRAVETKKAAEEDKEAEDAAEVDDYMSDSSDDEAAAFARAMRNRVRGGDSDDEPAPSRPRPAGKDVKGKGKFEPRTKGKVPREKGAGPKDKRKFEPRGKGEERRGKKPEEAPRRVRALSPPEVAPKEGSLRTLKRDAFGLHHHGRGKGQPKMGARMDALLEKIRRSR